MTSQKAMATHIPRSQRHGRKAASKELLNGPQKHKRASRNTPRTTTHRRAAFCIGNSLSVNLLHTRVLGTKNSTSPCVVHAQLVWGRQEALLDAWCGKREKITAFVRMCTFPKLVLKLLIKESQKARRYYVPYDTVYLKRIYAKHNVCMTVLA